MNILLLVAATAASGVQGKAPAPALVLPVCRTWAYTVFQHFAGMVSNEHPMRIQ